MWNRRWSPGHTHAVQVTLLKPRLALGSSHCYPSWSRRPSWVHADSRMEAGIPTGWTCPNVLKYCRRGADVGNVRRRLTRPVGMVGLLRYQVHDIQPRLRGIGLSLGSVFTRQGCSFSSDSSATPRTNAFTVNINQVVI